MLSWARPIPAASPAVINAAFLFAAVLEMAIDDLRCREAQHRDASIRLLTASGGAHKRHRDLLAACAGLDPEAFYDRVRPLAEAAKRMAGQQ